MWFGLENVFGVSCTTSACTNNLRWSDDTLFAYDSSWMANNFSNFDASQNTYVCIRMLKSSSSSYYVYGLYCNNQYPYVCQYDCNNVLDPSKHNANNPFDCVV